MSSLESDLKATAAANSRLQDQLAESVRVHASQDQRSLEDMEVLKAQVCMACMWTVCVSVSRRICLFVYLYPLSVGWSICISVWSISLTCPCVFSSILVSVYLIGYCTVYKIFKGALIGILFNSMPLHMRTPCIAINTYLQPFHQDLVGPNVHCVYVSIPGGAAVPG